jgi:hypothetical protein
VVIEIEMEIEMEIEIEIEKGALLHRFERGALIPFHNIGCC